MMIRHLAARLVNLVSSGCRTAQILKGFALRALDISRHTFTKVWLMVHGTMLHILMDRSVWIVGWSTLSRMLLRQGDLLRLRRRSVSPGFQRISGRRAS